MQCSKNRHLLADQAGATSIEYALIAALIAVALAGTFSSLGGEVTTHYQNIETSIDEAVNETEAEPAPSPT
ncbi:hypothetical protein GCM10009127_17650 [Alteraurantiacibacter aestuarii]|uniref:Flp family type IVb pilin n=1 Tax=Alteraurantiacibacter aestuarii TaxID=650004 RepID=A0A844ZKW0_9SPHN|nr:Flp family type IVb pilin [Alteraurantiacibacter aestuarii]MXO87650.1 Flp family type IVb pilin [Alteraurantiacibacter aestuarii]